MLLSSLRGAAVWAFRLEGVVHEHQTVPGVVEDIHQIVQRLKALTLTMPDEVDEATLELRAGKAGPVRAKDIGPSAKVKLVHPEHVLFTLQEDREIKGELFVNKGRGYVEAAQHPRKKSQSVDVVAIDAVYNPVRRANFTVQETRVGQRTDFDSLILSVETNGAISPEDAVTYAAALLQDHFKYFLDFGRVPDLSHEGEADTQSDAAMRDLLQKPIDDCGLSVRSINSLKNSGITILADLVKYSRDDLLKVKNVGDKAVEEIAGMLQREGLSFGMDVEIKDEELVASGEGAGGAAVAEPESSAE
jgi:DNA-directed RNA polymerase subunit alpha